MPVDTCLCSVHHGTYAVQRCQSREKGICLKEIAAAETFP